MCPDCQGTVASWQPPGIPDPFGCSCDPTPDAKPSPFGPGVTHSESHRAGKALSSYYLQLLAHSWRGMINGFQANKRMLELNVETGALARPVHPGAHVPGETVRMGDSLSSPSWAHRPPRGQWTAVVDRRCSQQAAVASAFPRTARSTSVATH